MILVILSNHIITQINKTTYKLINNKKTQNPKYKDHDKN